jgi:hypothetical protein
VLVSGVVVEDGVDRLAGQDLALDGVQKPDELLTIPVSTCKRGVPLAILTKRNSVVISIAKKSAKCQNGL